MSNDVVKVKRETIAACMTCPLCNNLFKQPTTISECLHTFCRKCIYDKFTDEDLECCPVCNIDLGCVPLEKLRPDHTKQDVRAKIFPLKGRKVKAPEPEVVAASEPLPAKRKERSLSSLVVNTPRVSVQTTMTGRRTKPTRKASNLRSSSFSIEKSIKKEAELLDDRPESSSSPEASNKLRQNNGQSEGSQSAPNRVTENDSKTCDTKMDLWKPLNCLVEVASRTKSLKSNNIQGSDAKPEPAQANESGSQVQKIKNKEKKRKAKVEDESISPFPVSSDTAKPNKLRRVRRKKEPFGESGISPQAVVDSTGSKLFKGGPIWFSLVASENQEGDTPLPQIPASYVRIKDGSVPVSFIQKYLMKKLDLTSETEIEIICMGQPVLPTLTLHNLVELWLDSTASTSHRIPAIIGSSAKDFVMVLAYARKSPHP